MSFFDYKFTKVSGETAPQCPLGAVTKWLGVEYQIRSEATQGIRGDRSPVPLGAVTKWLGVEY